MSEDLQNLSAGPNSIFDQPTPFPLCFGSSRWLTDSDTCLRFLRLLHPPGTRVEVRVKYRRTIRDGNGDIRVTEPAHSRRFADHEEAAKYAAEKSDADNTVAVWVTINPIDRSVPWGEGQKATKDKNIARRTAFFIDFDNQRPAGTNATEAERQESGRVARACRDWLCQLGFPQPILSDSGNGHHLLYRTELPADDGGLIKRFLLAVAGRFDTDKVKVDVSVHNPSRVCKLAGTCVRKGEDTKERPYRMADIIEAPDQLEPVSRELLEEVASEAPSQVERGTNPRQWQRGGHVSDDVHQRQIDAVLIYLKRVGIEPADIKPKDDMTVISLPCCPFKSGYQDDGDPGILIHRSGGISAKCFHEKCEGRSWSDVQEAFGIKYADLAKEIATEMVVGNADREFTDPMVLAEEHNSKWAMDDGTRTLVCFGEDTYRYSDVEGWITTTAKELEPWVRDTIQKVFDEYARVHSEITGKKKTPRPVRGNIVSDTIKTMESICKYEVPATWHAPFWLEEREDWSADDLLVFNNCVLNLRQYIEQRDDYIQPRTPKLFYESQANFDFAPDAPEPREWHKFLESLELSDDWIGFLQQVMGYCLWPAYDLQKFFMLVGPTRCGKGTITTVLENLVGGERAVCGPGLKDFASPFGLEQAVGKRLALVPEIRLPRDNPTEIVANLKAITGGDAVTVNRKYIPNVSMRLTMKIIMSTNNFVALPDNSGALLARLLPLKFTKSFLGQEDTELANKLVPEYPGIFCWALEGLRKLWSAGGQFAVAKSTQDELDQLLRESAPLQTFIGECCEVNATKGVQAPALYAIYRQWFESENSEESPLTDGQFANELKSALPSVAKKRASAPRQRERDGCQIVQTDDDNSQGRPYLWLGICPKLEFKTAVWAR